MEQIIDNLRFATDAIEKLVWSKMDEAQKVYTNKQDQVEALLALSKTIDAYAASRKALQATHTAK